MSAKGCSPDNAAAEGFLGRLKQEFFHKRSFQGISIDEFITLLDEYMVWYRDKRIKLEYGMSIMDKRIQLGARRLNVRAIVANDHSDNEVQQNVTAPVFIKSFHKA